MVKKNKKPETLDGVLETLSDVEGVKTAVITTDNGEIIGPGDALFAQGAAFAMDTAEKACYNLAADPPNEIILVPKSERIIVMRVDEEILLAARAKPEANQQSVSFEMLRAARAIEELMKRKKKA